MPSHRKTYFVHTDGLKVVCPSIPSDAYSMLREAIAGEDPVIFLEPIRRYWSAQEVTFPVTTEPLGQAVVRRIRTDLTIVSYGSMIQVANAAALIAQREAGRSIEVIDLRSLAPIDFDRVLQSVEKTGRCVVLHEAPRTLGIGAELAAVIQERAFYHLEAPVERVTGFDTPYPPARLEKFWLPAVDRVIDSMIRVLEY